MNYPLFAATFVMASVLFVTTSFAQERASLVDPSKVREARNAVRDNVKLENENPGSSSFQSSGPSGLYEGYNLSQDWKEQLEARGLRVETFSTGSPAIGVSSQTYLNGSDDKTAAKYNLHVAAPSYLYKICVGKAHPVGQDYDELVSEFNPPTENLPKAFSGAFSLFVQQMGISVGFGEYPDTPDVARGSTQGDALKNRIHSEDFLSNFEQYFDGEHGVQAQVKYFMEILMIQGETEGHPSFQDRAPEILEILKTEGLGAERFAGLSVDFTSEAEEGSETYNQELAVSLAFAEIKREVEKLFPQVWEQALQNWPAFKEYHVQAYKKVRTYEEGCYPNALVVINSLKVGINLYAKDGYEFDIQTVTRSGRTAIINEDEAKDPIKTEVTSSTKEQRAFLFPDYDEPVYVTDTRGLVQQLGLVLANTSNQEVNEHPIFGKAIVYREVVDAFFVREKLAGLDSNLSVQETTESPLVTDRFSADENKLRAALDKVRENAEAEKKKPGSSDYNRAGRASGQIQQYVMARDLVMQLQTQGFNVESFVYQNPTIDVGDVGHLYDTEEKEFIRTSASYGLRVIQPTYLIKACAGKEDIIGEDDEGNVLTGQDYLDLKSRFTAGLGRIRRRIPIEFLRAFNYFIKQMSISRGFGEYPAVPSGVDYYTEDYLLNFEQYIGDPENDTELSPVGEFIAEDISNESLQTKIDALTAAGEALENATTKAKEEIRGEAKEKLIKALAGWQKFKEYHTRAEELVKSYDSSCYSTAFVVFNIIKAGITVHAKASASQDFKIVAVPAGGGATHKIIENEDELKDPIQTEVTQSSVEQFLVTIGYPSTVYDPGIRGFLSRLGSNALLLGTPEDVSNEDALLTEAITHSRAMDVEYTKEILEQEEINSRSSSLLR